MKRLAVVIVLVAGFMALVTGCHRAPRYDARLVAADSLMHDYPDSALAIVGALSPDSLAGEGDRAYHDLLLTQARYKCYIVATTDSGINRALGYYRAHASEREKLTRAYIYKGAVMEELNHPDSAMLYYKQAEATAAPDDYFNLGQINTRIASLYRKYYANSQKCFERYNRAYNYHILSGNKRMQFNSLYNMVMMNGITHQNEQETLFERAVSLANELQDSVGLFDLWEIRCRQLSRKDSTWKKGKSIALNCLSNYKQYVNNDLLIDLAHIYVWDNKLDSAVIFLKLVNENSDLDEIERIISRKNEVLALISKKGGDLSSSSVSVIDKSNAISDSILNNKERYSIERIDNHFEQLKCQKDEHTIHFQHWVIIMILAAAAILLAFSLSMHCFRMKRINFIMEELRKSSINEHESLINQLGAQSTCIGKLVKNLVQLIKTVIEAGTAISSSKIAQNINETIVEVADDNFWKELRIYIDGKCNGMITNMAHRHGLKEKDLRFIELCCCGFSNTEIAIIMNYSLKYVSNKRKNITRKLDIDMPLQAFLNTMMNENR